MVLLPPAYVVRREGNSFTLFVSSHLGGVPISHNALQHFAECHGAATGGGVPSQVQPGWGDTLVGVTLPRRVPCPGGYPGQVPPPSQVRMGGTQLGQHREYLLHGGQYASCVHAGGLSCFTGKNQFKIQSTVTRFSDISFNRVFPNEIL